MSLDYEQLAEQWQAAHCYQTPAATQGWLTGYLAAGARLTPEQWLQEAQELLGLEQSPSAELAHSLTAFYQATLAALSDEAMTYSLFLPTDDNADVDEQVECLAQWSDGFLTGFGLAGRLAKALPGDVQEVLQDLAAFAQAELEDIHDPDNEKLYLELVEHARMAALTVFYSMQPQSSL